MFKDKNVLVTGSSGMIGKELVPMLKELGAIVFEADLPNCDLRHYDKCLRACEGMDYVFHLTGIKGNPRMTEKQPLDFFVPMVQFNTNMIEAARQNKVKRFLYTSSIAVENMGSDFYPAWAKLTGEHQLKAGKQQGDPMKYVIVRPANVYGRFDNFDVKEPMVITSLIKKALKDDVLNVWGDGSQERDFISASDCARGMIKAMEELPEIVNLCTGKGISIGEIAKFIGDYTGKEVVFDTSKPTGTQKRVMKLDWDFKPESDIFEEIKEIIKYKNE